MIIRTVLCLLFLKPEIVFSCTRCSTQLDSVLRETLNCKSKQVVGLSVAVIHSDEVLYRKGFGVKSLETNESITENTLFGIASLSKAFASTLLVKLIEDKTKYSLDTKIKTIFKNNEIFSDTLRSSYTTIRDLLAHRLGLPANNRMRLDNTLTRTNLIKRLKYLKPTAGFRDSFYYSNLMYGLVTYMAEIIGGDKWENLVTRHLFEPLGMTSSTFMTTADPDKIDLATGYIEYSGEFHPVPFTFSRHWAERCGSGCVLSSAKDMSKWMKFYLNGGKLPDGTRLISKNAYNQITRPVNVVPKTNTDTFFEQPIFPVTKSRTGYALGWKIGYYRGFNMLIHSGSTFGYRALLSIYPDIDFAIFTAMTGTDPNFLYRQSLHNFIFDTYNNFTTWLNSSTICSYPEPWMNVTKPEDNPVDNKDIQPTHKITEYFGVYSNPAYGTLEVKAHKDKNKLTIVYGISTFILYPLKAEDEFRGYSSGLTQYMVNFELFKFMFQVKSVSLKIPGFERKDPPLFQKVDHSSNSNKNGSGFQYIFLPLITAIVNMFV